MSDMREAHKGEEGYLKHGRMVLRRLSRAMVSRGGWARGVCSKVEFMG